MSRLLKVILPVLILAVGFGAFRLLVATKPEKASPSIQERVWRVAVEPVELLTAAPQLELYGRVETPDLLRATAPASAWVTEVLVQDGDVVAEGDVLLRLDERDFEPRIAQVEAEVADLEAQIASEKNRFETDRLALEQEQQLLELAQDAVERQQRLKTQRVGAEQALDDAKRTEAQQQLTVTNREMSIADHPSRLRGLEARRASAKARLAELRLEFERATLKAPYAGIVTGVEVTEGDQVTKGEALVRLYATESLEIRARIPAPYQDELIEAVKQDLSLSASATIGGESLQLRFDRLAGEADPSGVDALFKLDGDPTLLRLGQLLTVSLERPMREAVVEVPFRAVYGGDRIYLVEDGRMRGIDIESLGTRISADGEERLLVRSDQLAAGDALVTTHMPNAIEGLRVAIVGAEPPDGSREPTAGLKPEPDVAEARSDAPDSSN
ncbi:biotin/lipoyl-binding protein [Halochromatium roseum]|uniref:biotin/lipoyl-binding protein n=1 Tax=Halochromatium roseum TaxID=391920 RepID=UPI001912EAF0|nr:RND transporter [Halochromatium roseum]